MANGFDESKDVLIGQRELFVKGGKEKLMVECRKYDTYAPKLQLGRWFEKGGEWVPAKVGRLTKEDCEALIELLTAMRGHMDSQMDSQ